MTKSKTADLNVEEITDLTLASIPKPIEPDTEFDMFAFAGITPPDSE